MDMDMDVRKPLVLLLSVLICLLAGAAGSLVTITGPGSWYAEELVKPWFTPPGIVFPVVWTTLYILMGISLYLLLTEGRGSRKANLAITFFALQLAANAIWSFLFFGMQNPLYGLVDIVLLWFLIVATIYYAGSVNRYAAYLLLPYIVWVSIATCLNYSIAVLNGFL